MVERGGGVGERRKEKRGEGGGGGGGVSDLSLHFHSNMHYSCTPVLRTLFGRIVSLPAERVHSFPCPLQK